MSVQHNKRDIRLKVLYKTRAIRESIKVIFSDMASDRFAIVGFVGPTPLEWIANPEGVAVYCWPRAGGTHPAGIDALVAAGAKVYFTNRLHSKVFHSSTGGTVLGSANLSANALAEGRLIETAVYLPTGAFSIAKQLDELTDAVSMDHPRFAEIFAEFRRQRVAFCQRNPDEPSPRGTRSKQRTFAEWAAMPNRDEWQLGVWSDDDDAPEDAVAKFEAATGSSFSNFRAHSNSANVQLQVPTLSCQIPSGDDWDIGSCRPTWWYPDFQTTTAQPEWENYSHVWFARRDIPAGCVVPFKCDEQRFRGSLRKAVKKFAASIDEFKGPVKQDFIDELLLHYEAG
jgi:hypothetical protein